MLVILSSILTPGTLLILTGDHEQLKEKKRAILIANHQIYPDCIISNCIYLTHRAVFVDACSTVWPARGFEDHVDCNHAMAANIWVRNDIL